MGKRILLADDSMTIQKLVEMAFVDTDHELVCMSHGQEAWEIMEQFQPHVILADAIMPVLDGYGLCEKVKSSPKFSHIPVVLLTGRFQPFDEDRAEQVKIDSRMMKPFVQDQLVELVEKLAASAPTPAQIPKAPVSEIFEEESADLPGEDFFDDEEIEPIDGDFLEPGSMDETENLEGLVAETQAVVDSNTTIRVDQDELRSYLRQNRALDFNKEEKAPLDEVDSLDLDSVESFNDDEDFLKEEVSPDTLESGMSSDEHVDDEEYLDPVSSFEDDDNELEELELDDEEELLELDEEDYLNEENSDQWEDILDEEETKSLNSEEIPSFEQGPSDLDQEFGLEDDMRQDNQPQDDLPQDDLQWGEPESDPDSIPYLPEEQIDDSTISLDRDEMNHILTEEESDELRKKEEGDDPFAFEEASDDNVKDLPENEFSPDFLEKDTLPLDDMDDSLDFGVDEEADTIPMDGDSSTDGLMDGDELDITGPLLDEDHGLLDLEADPLELDELVEEPDQDGPYKVDLERDSLGMEIFPEEDEDQEIEIDDHDSEELDVEIELESVEDLPEEDLPEEIGVMDDLGEDTIPGAFADELGVPEESRRQLDFEDVDSPLFSDEDEEPFEDSDEIDLLEEPMHESLSMEVEAEEMESMPPELVVEEAYGIEDDLEPVQFEESESGEPEEMDLDTEPHGLDADMVHHAPSDSDELVFDDEPEDAEEENSIETEADDPVRLIDEEPFLIEHPTEELDDSPAELELDDMSPPERFVPEPVQMAQEPMTDETLSDDGWGGVPEEEDVHFAEKQDIQEVSAHASLPQDEFEPASPEPENMTHVQGNITLSDEQLELLVNKVVERLVKTLSSDAVKEVAWEVVPALAEAMVERRIFEIEQEKA